MRPIRSGAVLAMAFGAVSGCSGQPPVPITRADLAASYVELEQVYFGQTGLDAGQIADANRRFDEATLAFFAANAQAAIEQIEALTAGLRPQPQSPGARLGAALKATLEPPVYIAGSGAAASVRLTGMYPIRDAGPDRSLTLRLIDAAGVAHGAPVRLVLNRGAAGFVDVTAALRGADALAPGAARTALYDEDGQEVATWKWDVVAESLDARRNRIEALLASVAADAGLTDALAACRARNALLTDRPSASNAAQYLVDLEALANDVAAEAGALAAGRNPYARRTGRYWRTFSAAAAAVPAWVFAPQVATGAGNLPLVIALHGAGGDEAMFIYGYGAGRITQLAEERGFVVVSPATGPFAASLTHFDAIVEAVAADYAIDRERIYVIGHSMGTGAAAGLAIARAEVVAGVCCIAGGGFAARGVTKLAPLLGVLGQLDPLAAPARVEAALRAAQAAGLPVAYRIVPDYGHTLLVGAELPAVIEWLLARRRDAAPAEATAAPRPIRARETPAAGPAAEPGGGP